MNWQGPRDKPYEYIKDYWEVTVPTEAPEVQSEEQPTAPTYNETPALSDAEYQRMLDMEA